MENNINVVPGREWVKGPSHPLGKPKISVDLGYGYVKAVNEYGRKVIFPSVVAADPGGSALSDALGGQQDYTVKVRRDGRETPYLVGEAAVAAAWGSRAWEENQAIHENTGILLATAVALLEPAGPVCLAVGLPLMTYGSQRQSLIEFLRGFSADTQVGGGRWFKIAFDPEIFVFPQGGGALYHSALHLDGSLRDASLLSASAVGVVDVGYRTTDYLVMRKGPRGLAVRPELSDSFDLGYSWVYQQIRQALRARTGRSLDLQRIEESITRNDGLMTYKGEPIDLQPLEEDANTQLASMLVGRLKSVWGENLDLVNHLIVAGGGGAKIYPHFKRLCGFATLAPDPVFANATGYLAARNMALQARSHAR